MAAPLLSSRLLLAWRWLSAGALAYAALFVFYRWPLTREFQTAFVGEAQGDVN
jgi:hypothetical protein